MTAAALRRWDTHSRRVRQHAASIDGAGSQMWRTMRSRPLDFNLDYTPQALCCATCQRPIEDACLEDQAGRPACSASCAAGPHFEPDPCATASPFVDDGHIPRTMLAGHDRERIKAMRRRLRAIPEPFELADDEQP